MNGVPTVDRRSELERGVAAAEHERALAHNLAIAARPIGCRVRGTSQHPALKW